MVDKKVTVGRLPHRSAPPAGKHAVGILVGYRLLVVLRNDINREKQTERESERDRDTQRERQRPRECN